MSTGTRATTRNRITVTNIAQTWIPNSDNSTTMTT